MSDHVAGKLALDIQGPNNGFYQLTSLEGSLILENGQNTTTTPIGGIFNVGSTGNVQVKPDIFAGTTMTINGTLANYGTVTVVGPNAVLNAGNILNVGTLTPPEGSTVNVANGFYQLAKGTLGETIRYNGFSILAVNGGLVSLNGTLDVLLDPNFYPAAGTTYDFLTFKPGLLSGTFASILNREFNNGTEYWVVNYNNAGGYVSLTAEPVPEPATLPLFGSGLMVGVGV